MSVVAMLEWLRRHSGDLLSRAEFLAEMERLGLADPEAVGCALDAILAEEELLLAIAIEVTTTAALTPIRARMVY